MSNNIISVTKRDGSKEAFDISKITRIIKFATRGLDVSTSQIEMTAKLHLHDGIDTSSIHDSLIHSTANLISVDEPDYQYAAARMASYQMRKQAYGSYEPPHLLEHTKKLVSLKRYTEELLQYYTEEEYDELNNYIDHERDDLLTYVGIRQIINKYCVRDKTKSVKDKKWVLETPQMIFMLIPMCLFSMVTNKQERLEKIKKFYDLTSKLIITLPTPIIAGVRTLTKQFSSCVKIDMDDSLDGINASMNSIVKYVAQRAGIGLNVGRIRAVGSMIRHGEAEHTGIVPFIKLAESAVGSCNQGNVRKGAATLYFPVWHYEVDGIIVLKNNKGIAENRARHLDYAVQLNRHFYKKAYGKTPEERKYYLFSPSDVPGMYDAFFQDQALFEELYEKYSNDPNIRKKECDASELFNTIASERSNTGRIYIMNVDHANTNTPFDTTVAPIFQSNLCVSGETSILIQDEAGIMHVPIKNREKKWVNVFNGEEFTPAYVERTSKLEKVYHVLFHYYDKYGNAHNPEGHEKYIRATAKHNWYVLDDDPLVDARYVVKTTDELRKGDVMQHAYIEDGIVKTGNAVVQGVMDYNAHEPVYCLNEIMTHKSTFNGVVAGQCVEIALPTKPLTSPKTDDGEIALCTLSAINVMPLVDERGNLDYRGLEKAVSSSVESLDYLLSYQDYPFEQARNATLNRRPLGISITNLAGFLAKVGYRYDDKGALELVDRLMEAVSFFAIKTSCRLAQEHGACKDADETLWTKGVLPFDRCNKNARALVNRTLSFSPGTQLSEEFGSWEDIRKMLKTTGIRNSTLLTQAPTETSSQVTNTTNGIEPPRGLVSTKASNEGQLRQIVPDVQRYGINYTTLWSLTSNEHIINIASIMQTWICQSISTNLSYDPTNTPDKKVSLNEVRKDITYAYKMGLKTLYYHNTRDGQKEDNANALGGCEGGACAI